MVKTNSEYRSIRKKLMAAIAMVLVASIMVVSSSYAWFTLSTAPEVKGITTSVGSNGNLEMALRTEKGKLPENTTATVALPTVNTYWGNLVDLSHESYHMDQMALRPARLNTVLDEAASVEREVQATQDGKLGWWNGSDPASVEYAETQPDGKVAYMVKELASAAYKFGNGGYLQTPVYGVDGRVSALEPNTTNGAFSADNNAFAEDATDKVRGVRAVGTVSDISPAELALRNARAAVNAAITNTQSIATISLRDDSVNLANIFVLNILDSSITYTDADKTKVANAIDRLQSIVDVELLNALKQAVIAVGVSQGITLTADDIDFTKTNFVKEGTPADKTPDWTSLSAEKADLSRAYGKLSTLSGTLGQAETKLNALTGGSYTFSDLSDPVTMLLSTDDFLIEGKKVADLRADLASAAVIIFSNPTISIKSGIYFEIAEYSGNVSAMTSMHVPEGNYMGVPVGAGGMNITVTMATVANDKDTARLPNGFHLVYIQSWLPQLTANGAITSETLLTDIYGYAVDMIFRTNASGSSLQLQTDAVDRVDSQAGEESPTQGGGSYMKFKSGHADFTTAQVLNLMGSIRVVFINDAGTIFGIAALDTTLEQVMDGENPKVATDTSVFTVPSGTNDAQGNPIYYEMSYAGYDETTGEIKAPLYMYDFSLENGKLVLGEQSVASVITALGQNQAQEVTALVYLDGDTVENGDVAIAGNSMTGTMNLQFSSTANLDPMDYTFQAVDADAPDAPSISISGNNLTVTEAEGAAAGTTYEVYVNGQPTSKTIAVGTHDLSTALSGVSGVTGTVSITVVAKVGDKTSAQSNSVDWTIS